jgi:hypothetical protein
MAADITAIPGMLLNNTLDHTYDDAQNTTEMAATLLATAVGNRAQIHGLMWKTTKQHTLGQIKSWDFLFQFVKAVTQDREATFEKQTRGFEMLMLQRLYLDKNVEDYV